MITENWSAARGARRRREARGPHVWFLMCAYARDFETSNREAGLLVLRVASWSGPCHLFYK
jgi:hypothetical protein